MTPRESVIIREILANTIGKKILNVGSGDQYYYKSAQPFIYNNVIAPLSKHNTIYNLDHRPGEGVDIVDDFESMDNVTDESIDIVLCNSCIGFTKSSRSLIMAIYRILKHDGTALFSAPGAWNVRGIQNDTGLRMPTRDSWDLMLSGFFNINRFFITEPNEYGFMTGVFATKDVRNVDMLYTIPWYRNVYKFYIEPYSQICAAINKIIKFDSIIDIGCGAGNALEYFHSIGKRIAGVDGSAGALVICPRQIHDYIRRADIRYPLSLEQTFDVSLSIEVAEHLEEEYANQFLKTLSQHATKHIVMTAAPPIQRDKGIHHVNCQEKIYWIERVEKMGWIYNEQSTEAVQSTCKDVTTPWVVRNIMIFDSIGA